MSIVKKRRITRQITIGSVKIGGGAPVAVQSMTNTYTQDVASTAFQIQKLSKAGCEIIRVAIPDMEAARAVKKIKKQIDIPLIADIHFDHRLAIAAAENGADALRINPGNIGAESKVKKVVQCAKNNGISIRIGVNSGSLEKDIELEFGNGSEAMAKSAQRNIELVRGMDFHDIKLSVKASDVSRTVEAYRLVSSQTDLPLHVGVTEAGGLIAGISKSALGIGMILAEGIGDTIRVSLTRDPGEEIRTAWEILRALEIRKRGVEIISCPTCGRCRIDLFNIAEKVENALLEYTTPVKIAIMGCVVNGPGEAKEADIGIAGGDGIGILFKKGKFVKKVPQDQLIDVLLEEVKKYTMSRRELNGEKG